MEVLYYQSPIGNLKLVAEDEFLKEIRFSVDYSGDGSGNPVLTRTARQLAEYFKGVRTDFDLPLKPDGTGFQQKVWRTLSTIPYGVTLSYLDLAKRLGDENALRAAGRANAGNPIPIVIPCHRVVGKNGKLTGYSGGIERKRWLLKHEGALLL